MIRTIKLLSQDSNNEANISYYAAHLLLLESNSVPIKKAIHHFLPMITQRFRNSVETFRKWKGPDMRELYVGAITLSFFETSLNLKNSDFHNCINLLQNDFIPSYIKREPHVLTGQIAAFRLLFPSEPSTKFYDNEINKKLIQGFIDMSQQKEDSTRHKERLMHYAFDLKVMHAKKIEFTKKGLELTPFPQEFTPSKQIQPPLRRKFNA